jgi:uncharacterized membrane protein
VAKVEASVEVGAPLAEVWDLYFDPARWASWVDGFGSVESSDGYPERGGTLVWRSTPAGRGQVRERVVEHQPRSVHRIEFADPGSTGLLDVSFEMLPSATADSGRRTRVEQRLDYRVTSGGPLRAVTDLLFIRGQMRGSLQRSLVDLRLEAERIGGTQKG